MMMPPDKRQRLEANGWKVGTVGEFLEDKMLTPDMFNNLDEFVKSVNRIKIDKWTKDVILPDSEESARFFVDSGNGYEEQHAQDFIKLWRQQP